MLLWHLRGFLLVGQNVLQGSSLIQTFGTRLRPLLIQCLNRKITSKYMILVELFTFALESEPSRIADSNVKVVPLARILYEIA